MHTTAEHDAKFVKLTFASIYPLYIAKVQKKNRTIQELNTVIAWLTGFDENNLQQFIQEKDTFSDFFEKATLQHNACLITGMICGYRIEEIENPLTKQVRYLDKLVDELAKGKPVKKILR
jgi:hypothetical protein